MRLQVGSLYLQDAHGIVGETVTSDWRVQLLTRPIAGKLLPWTRRIDPHNFHVDVPGSLCYYDTKAGGSRKLPEYERQQQQSRTPDDEPSIFGAPPHGSSPRQPK